MSLNSSVLYIPARAHAVINGSFDRDPSLSMWSTFYVDSNGNPTGSRPFAYPKASQPFIAESKAFYDILGLNPTLEVVAQAETSQFHEAGVYVPDTNEVFFTSNIMATSAGSSNYTYPLFGNFSKISLKPNAQGVYPWEVLMPPSETFVLPNGGTFYNDKVLMVVQGYKLSVPSSIIVIDPKTLSAETLLNNFYGRPFNSLNDIAVLTKVGGGQTPLSDQWLFFTDPPYGYYQGFKEYPRLPAQAYAFHPPTGTIRVVADGFLRPNGILFSPDMLTCYISDTGFVSAAKDDPHPQDGSRPGTIYAYDVVHPPKGSDPTTHPPSLTNRRVFAFTDSGMPDGLKADTDGNIYGGCFDGVHIWNKNGALMGKILLGLDVPSPNPGVPAGRGCANMVFVPGGLLMFAEDRMYLAKLKAKGALLP
ncbi:SMP-30/gluconolaconase/LRE-like region protein [Ceratobasidium sp. AG-Ba]|nr:SMP-30/gluconolaconase/LRE-like region protein [Ceratobasidium sp. AG-Ba]QRV99509.1 SMP-30/gluconolaconase/LRE-like region protein [Ceratobasidium sp. AG-Ba]QRW14018.1 SMP-30/gluconolaconase/LRE-like region protein [Ceratobasidium sp. AG-Ba]